MVALALTLALAFAVPDGGTPPTTGSGPAPAPSLLAPIGPLKAPPADRGYELHRAKDGTGDLLYEGPGFKARIGRDGTARFIDKHFTLLAPWSFLPFTPLAPPRGRASLQSTFEDLLARRKPGRGWTVDADPPPGPVPLLPQMSPYRPDPKEVCTYPRPCYFDAGVVVIGLGGTFDLTDELMRLSGQDPYRREKANFLAATSQLRGGLAARALGENIRSALGGLPARLEEIACDPQRSVRERRAIVEALRQEIEGDTPAAREAVATITRFLETRFEPGDRGVRCSAPTRSGD
jgi:hypothetical protein